MTTVIEEKRTDRTAGAPPTRESLPIVPHAAPVVDEAGPYRSLELFLKLELSTSIDQQVFFHSKATDRQAHKFVVAAHLNLDLHLNSHIPRQLTGRRTLCQADIFCG